MSPASDVELLLRWAKGDNEAGQALTRRHFVNIRAYFLTKAPYEHVELIKETFARIPVQLSSFNSRSSFRVHVYGIARTLLIECFRRLRRDPKLDPMDSSAAALDDARPKPVLGEGPNYYELFDALRQLPLREQDMLELRYFQGLAAGEIAAIHGAQEDAVRSQLHEALGRLGERLGKARSGKLGPNEVEGLMDEARAGLSNLRLVTTTTG